MTDLTFTNLTVERVADAHRLEHQTFTTVEPADLYDLDEMVETVQRFPEGNFMVLDPADGNRLVGIGMGILVEFDPDTDRDLHKIDGGQGAAVHHPDNSWYYGTTIAVEQAYRGRGVGRKLYALRKQCVRDLNKVGIVAGGVLPGYRAHVDHLSADDYIRKVSAGELHDPTLSFQLREGFRVIRSLPNYMRDVTVANAAALIVWDNPDYTHRDHSQTASNRDINS